MKTIDRSLLRNKDGIFYFEIPEMERLGWLRHAFLTRHGGISISPFDSLNMSINNGDRPGDVLQNKELIASAFGLPKDRLVLLKQRQKDEILVLKNPVERIPPPLPYDATITDASNLPLGILTADCIPIFITDIKKKVIAAIHSGRQGTSLGITKKVLRKMRDGWNCSMKDLIIAMGPSIGPCCYEIDEKVFNPGWEPFSTSNGEGRWMVDLARINIAQMKDEGIGEEQIFRVDICTCCRTDLFFSYRKEGKTGRQLSFIEIV